MAEPDIFVGTLTRYYSAAWDTVGSRDARLRGEQFQLFKKSRPGTPLLNPAEIEPLVRQWRADLTEKMRSHLPEPLDWEEGMAPSYFSRPIGKGGCGGLILAAAYVQFPHLRQPISYVEDWRLDEAVRACLANKGGAALFNIVSKVLWLPGNFRFGTATVDPAGEPVELASLGSLSDALRSINEGLFGASEADIKAWQQAGLARQTGFIGQIRFGFAAFAHTCDLAIRHNVPMKLHF